jgi:transcriptional regulator with XRE-family HTH domain
MATVGSRIRQVREQLGRTQDALAAATGLSKGFISEVENDKRNLSAQNLLKIANALGASVEYLLLGLEPARQDKEPVVIPPELSQAAEQLGLTYVQTLAVLDTHRSVLARRSTGQKKPFTVQDWIQLHRAIENVFE